MAIITDEYMRQMMENAKEYCVCIVHITSKRREPGANKLVWEHDRRRFSLRADGVLAILCPIADESGVSGVYIFNADAHKVAEIMEADPAVQAGVFTYELHPSKSFPGDELPK
jgi:uncharacterized protein YciI